MTRQLLYTISLIPFVLSATVLYGENLILCGQEEVFIIDCASNPSQKIWSWKASECPSLPDSMISKFRSTDECKPVDGGK